MNYPVSLSLKTGVLASVLALAAGGALAQTTVNAVMHSDLRVLDPVITTAHITRDQVVSRMWWKLPNSGLRACNVGSSQAARSRDIGTRG